MQNCWNTHWRSLKFAKGKDLKVGKTLNRDEADEVRTAPHSTSDLLGLIGFPNPSLGGTMCMGQALRMNAHLTSSHHSTGEIQTCCHTMSYGPIQSRNQAGLCVTWHQISHNKRATIVQNVAGRAVLQRSWPFWTSRCLLLEMLALASVEWILKHSDTSVSTSSSH